MGVRACLSVLVYTSRSIESEDASSLSEFDVMVLTELQIAVAIVSVLSVALMFTAFRVWHPKKSSEMDQSLEAMINGFDFELPEEVELYRKFKEENKDDRDACFNMLFRRAVSDIPLIRKIQSESSGIQRLRKNDLLKEGSFMSYKMAEEIINEEINDVRREAEELKPGEGWPDKIFPQAVQFLNHMAEQQMQGQAPPPAADATNAASGVAEQESSADGDEGLRKRK